MADLPTSTLTPASTTATPATGGGLIDQARGLLNGNAPIVDQAKSFAKARPFATAALAGVIGVALLNTLRGK
ncbi:hypothetical protein [Sphingomonas bacterium]|uniref:hypothetical protein n=1 Tax=Sphingomonas bacterium TaxID=1895847 RepID=UPI001576FD14|nr:hypothetical protein [Sphingomonas bacterium]